jgi:hypothetical protein
MKAKLLFLVSSLAMFAAGCGSAQKEHLQIAFPGSTQISFDCQDGKLVSILGGADLRIGQQACRFIKEHPNFPQGNFICSSKDRSLVNIKLTRGNRTKLSHYSYAGCPSAEQVWSQVSPMWVRTIAGTPQVSYVFVHPPTNFQAIQPNWLAQQRWFNRPTKDQLAPCVQSLPYWDMKVCIMPYQSKRGTRFAVQFTKQQMQQLKNASPETVTRMVLTAKQVPMPSGFPR